MKVFEVIIKEELVKTKVVGAESEAEAIDKVKQMYHNEEIEFDWSDFSDVTFEANKY
jgi:hypothetical protein